MSLKVKFGADSSEFDRVAKGVSNTVSGLGKSLAGITVALAGAVAASAAIKAIGGYIMDASKAAAEFETTSVAFEVLAGSADKARKVLAEIQKFGATTPLEQKDLQEATKTLMQFGVEIEDTMPLLRMLGDVSMGNAENLKGLALVFGQISSLGKLMGGDLLQLIGRGFNPLIYISKRTGENMTDLRKRMETTGISFAEVKQALADATGEGGKFNGMLQRIGQTTEGKIANMKDSWDALKVTMGQAFNVGISEAIDHINDGFDKITPIITKFSEMLGNAIGDAIQGDATKLVSLGVAIGEMIVEGVKLGLSEIGKQAHLFMMHDLPAMLGVDKAAKTRGTAERYVDMMRTAEIHGAAASIAGRWHNLNAMIPTNVSPPPTQPQASGPVMGWTEQLEALIEESKRQTGELKYMSSALTPAF